MSGYQEIAGHQKTGGNAPEMMIYPVLFKWPFVTLAFNGDSI